MKPLVCYVTWNRLGISLKSLELLLKTEDDFDLILIDNASSDGTATLLEKTRDPRLKEVKLLHKNMGYVFALNYAISRRSPGQPFIMVDADLRIKTPRWISNIVRLHELFPEVGLIGSVRPNYFEQRKDPYEDLTRGGKIFRRSNFVLSCCLYFPSEILDILGYFNEELHFFDMDVSARVQVAGKWIGYCMENLVTSEQTVNCAECNPRSICQHRDIKSTEPHCIKVYKSKYLHRRYYETFCTEFEAYRNALTPSNLFCGSIHDVESQKKVKYNLAKAERSFRFFST